MTKSKKRRFRRRSKWGPKPSSNYIARSQDDLYKKRGARTMPIGVTGKRAFRFSKARVTRIAGFGRKMPGSWLIKKILRRLFPPPQIPPLTQKVVEYRGERQILPEERR